MRILHLNNEKTWRGGERQTLFLAAELHIRGLESVIACRRGGPLEAQARRASVPVIPVRGSNPLLFANLLAIDRGFDLIHCHTGRGHSVAAVRSLFRQTPLIVTRRVDFLPSRSFFNRFKFARARKVVCISQFIAAQLRAWGVPKDKLMVIPSAVPRPALPPSRAAVADDLRRRLKIPGDRRIVGNIAAMVGHKDQATLLRAARRVVSQHPDVAVVIIGEGELRPQLEQQRRALNLEADVFFAGFIPDAEKLLPAFDVFVMSSSMEGLGSIVLDAFAAGVPVAATAGGGLPELVRDRETGLLAPVGNDLALSQAVIELLASDTLVQGVTKNAREFVSGNFSVGRMADSYLGIYKTIIKD